MATKAEVLAQIENNVFKIVGETIVENKDGLQTIDVICLITIDAEGSLNKVTQRLYVESTGEAYLGGVIRKNYVAPVNETALKEQFFLSKLQDLETALGAAVKIDTNELSNLGIQYLVFGDPTDGKKKVTTTLAGTTLIREAI